MTGEASWTLITAAHFDTISVTEMLEREIQYGRLEVDNVNDAKVRPKECIR